MPSSGGVFFLLPMSTQLTKKGLEALKRELELLLNEKRPKLVERLSAARSHGDLSENSDYQNAREELEFLDGRISELEVIIKGAKIVDNKLTSKEQVGVGNSVRVKVGNQESVFYLVGEWEANPAEKKISITSPLGRAILGRKKGEKVEIEAPAGTVVYEIVDIV